MTFTREDLPADVKEVATQETARKWEHFRVIADKLPAETNLEVGLLIGANCLKALEPKELLSGKDGGPIQPF